MRRCGSRSARRSPRTATAATASRSSRRHSRALELSLALADRLADAIDRAARSATAAAEELQRAFGCPIVHVVAHRAATDFVLRAERGADRRRARGWTQNDRRRADRAAACAEGAPGDQRRRHPRAQLPRDRRDPRRPLRAGRPDPAAGGPWGVINLEDTELDAFDEDDARLLESVAAPARRRAQRDRPLRAASTAPTSAPPRRCRAALEAKDTYTAEHSRVDRRQRRRRRPRASGWSAEELRMLRYAAAFHDIGKLAHPPRDPQQARPPRRRGAGRDRAAHRRSASGSSSRSSSSTRSARSSATPTSAGTAAATRTASPATTIPLGARIVFACDAYDAMTTDRTYSGRHARGRRPSASSRRCRSPVRPGGVEALLEVLSPSTRPALAARPAAPSEDRGAQGSRLRNESPDRPPRDPASPPRSGGRASVAQGRLPDDSPGRRSSAARRRAAIPG